MKRQILACAGILLALCLLFEHQKVFEGIDWVVRQVSREGFVVEYYRNDQFDEIMATRGERELLKDYGNKRPAPGVPKSTYAARWYGWLTVPETAEYGFFVQSLGGARFFIDDDLVLDHGDASDWYQGKHGKAYLTSGVYRVRLEHVKLSGKGAVRLRWAGGPVPANTLLGAPFVTKEQP